MLSQFLFLLMGKKSQQWRIDEYGLAGELKDSPVVSNEETEEN